MSSSLSLSKVLAFVVLSLSLGLWTAAAESVHESSMAQHGEASELAPNEVAAPHPVISQDASWTQPTLLIIAAMFAAAWLVGPTIRRRMPTEVPPAHSHDEPPGSSHHHGPEGTVTPDPGHHGH